MLSIKILGSGCPNCKRVEQLTRKSLGQLKLEADIQKVTDQMDIIDMGVMATPGLVINDKVVCKGRVPSLDEIASYLKDAAGMS